VAEFAVRFIDEAKIKISAGRGGPGSVSFRRETFIPRGGPDGGEGGAGGDVIFRSTVQLSTLQDFRLKREYRAGNGEHGSGCSGDERDGDAPAARCSQEIGRRAGAPDEGFAGLEVTRPEIAMHHGR
jgi:hypothetical protein